MATLRDWVEGARLRTLPAAIAPVLAGTGVAWFEGRFDPLLAGLALVVALAIQVGANLANDYSDGIRGTDAVRVGPMRLVGSGAASARAVKLAAFGSFAVAGLVGAVAVALSGDWWLLAVGLACVVAAWFYTGGKHPYGYFGLGEIFVFVFFGLVAVCGTVHLQVGALPAAAWWAGVAIGALTVDILVANNLRDLDGDRAVGKLTLATRIGDAWTRRLYVALAVVALAGVFAIAATSTWWALLGWLLVVPLARPVVDVVSGAIGRDLIRVLKHTGFAVLACAVGLAAGLVIGGL